jgi:GNAT superfamily N-acetyltransferase
MWWRLARSEFNHGKGASNRAALRRLTVQGPPPGILAYAGRSAVGWCALAPREDYPALERSRILAPVDAQPVWSVTCFFIERAWRRKRLSVALLEAAAGWAGRRGARILEGYPVEPGSQAPDPFVWTGLASAYRAAGFKEVARRSRTRPIMRRSLAPPRRPSRKAR